MSSNDQDEEYIKKLTAMALGHAMKNEKPKESSGLFEQFRCPQDGSTNTQAVQEILDGSVTSVRIDRKTVSAVVESPLLERYRVGPKPRLQYELLPLSGLCFLLVFVALGMWTGGSAAFFSLMALAFSAGSLLVFWEGKKRLPDEIAKWEQRMYVAKYKWHCHSCGNPFLPRPPESKPSAQEKEPSQPPEGSPDGNLEYEMGPLRLTDHNVTPLIPNASGGEEMKH